MADSTSASEGNVLRTYERGLALYGEDEWSLAARSFDMVSSISLRWTRLQAASTRRILPLPVSSED